jgi:hypothetical protein
MIVVILIEMGRRLRRAMKPLAHRLDDIIIERTRVRLFIRYAEFWQNTQDFPRFYF